MEPIKTQNVWIEVNPISVKNSSLEYALRGYLEKKSDMIVMTVEEFKKVVVAAMNKGSDYFLEDVGTWEKFKTEYINQLIK